MKITHCDDQNKTAVASSMANEAMVNMQRVTNIIVANMCALACIFPSECCLDMMATVIISREEM